MAALKQKQETDEIAASVKQRSSAVQNPSAPAPQPQTGEDGELLDDAAILAAAKDAAEKTAKAETLQVKADEKAVEGHGVQSQQAQQTAGAAAQAATNKQANANGKTDNGVQNKSSLTGDTAPNKGANETPDISSQKQTEAPTAKAAPVAQSQQTNTQPNHPPLTPERIAGFNGSTAAESFAAGLSGLKGEGSFASTFGLLGGKPSPALGAHVAKQVNLQVSRAVRAGQNEFTVRLDPAELGRVQIKMSFADGKVSTKIIAERPETLELMQREVRGLERAMETGGHKASSDGISFSLDTGDGQKRW